tara:strand:- start:1274 stop:2038 length:765 start_codon:yes stop_codon:yes gene_type:complete
MIDCIIQARMGSSRLPGKVMMKIDSNHTVLDSIISQLEHCKLINRIIIATTKKDEDNIIEKYCLKNLINIFRGNELDVLDRYFQCAKEYDSKDIVRITADCPLIDPEIVDKVISEYIEKKYDYSSNVLNRTFPIGTDVEVFSFKILKKVWENAKLPSEREHVTLFIRNNKVKCKIGNFESKKNLKHIRITLDRQEDLELLREIKKNLKQKPILINDIVKLMNEKPELLKINQNILNDEGIKKSLRIDEEHILKD